jgi:hypothetical protein
VEKMENPTGSNGAQPKPRLVEREGELGCAPLFAGGVEGEEDSVWGVASFFLAGHTATYSAPSQSLYLFGGYDGR